jgi:peroxiredoxin
VLIPTPVRLFAALAIVVAISACDSRSAAPPVGSGPQDGTDESVTVQLLREPLDVEPFTLTDLSGRQLSSADWKGKVVLVNFWATWCTTCVQEMPKMVDTYRKFAPRGYEMVAVAVQSDHPNNVAAFAQKRALPFKVALDGDGDIAKQFGRVRITPTSFLIDKNGRVLKEYVGEPDWAEFHALVEKALRS